MAETPLIVFGGRGEGQGRSKLERTGNANPNGGSRCLFGCSENVSLSHFSPSVRVASASHVIFGRITGAHSTNKTVPLLIFEPGVHAFELGILQPP